MVSEGGRSAGANLYTAFRRPPLVAGATTFLHGKACHWILARLLAPYSTAITDSLDSQVATAPLRIQFAGVTPVPLPPEEACHWILSRPRAPYESSSLATPLKRGHYGRWAVVFICVWNSSEGKPYNRAAPVGNAPLLVLRTTSPKGKHVTGFSGRFAPLQIQFLCHPGGGSFSGAMLCDAYEFIGSLRIVVPPQAGALWALGILVKSARLKLRR